MKTIQNVIVISALAGLGLTGCGGSGGGGATTISDTQGDVSFTATLTVNWTSSDFPTNYPSNPHFSPLVGTAHNEQVKFWESGGQPATDGIESMAETGATTLFENEIKSADLAGYSQGVVKGTGIGSGTGSASVSFSTSDTYPLLTLVSMIAPSPDWFVGVHGYELKNDQDEWIDEVTINLPLYDAGTDTGLTFSAADIDSSGSNLAITLLSSNRTDTDFSNGVHHSSGKYVATLTIKRVNDETEE